MTLSELLRDSLAFDAGIIAQPSWMMPNTHYAVSCILFTRSEIVWC